MIYIVIFSLLHMIKGGLLVSIPAVENAIKKPVFKYVFDGKIVSSLVCIPVCILAGFPEWQAMIFAAAWWVSMSPSLGEEIGAIGGYKGVWLDLDGNEDYTIKNTEGGWKKGVQRGIFTGAILSLAAWNPLLVIAGATFPVCVWCGISIGQLYSGNIQEHKGWRIYEGIFGAAIGLAFWMGA